MKFLRNCRQLSPADSTASFAAAEARTRWVGRRAADTEKPVHGDGDRGLSSLAVCATSATGQFASGSYDQTVKLWGVRRRAGETRADKDGGLGWGIVSDGFDSSKPQTAPPHLREYEVTSRDSILSIEQVEGASASPPVSNQN